MLYLEVKEQVKAYACDPSAEKLQDLLTLTVPLSPVERADIIREPSAFNTSHGMTKKELQAEISRLQKSVTEETDFFENGILKPIRVVDALQRENHYLTTAEDGKLRVYQEGVFAPDETRQTARDVIDLLGDDVNRSDVGNVLSLLSDVTLSTLPENKDWINFSNGRWCLDSWQFLEHSSVHPSVIQLPVKFEPKAKCPHFDAWLSDVLPSEADRFLLLQLFGYSMRQDVRYGKLAVFVGPTHTGKSTRLDLLTAFLGRKNVSALSLHALDNEERRFSRAGLVGKLANMSADLSSKHLAGDSQVKQMVVGDPMQVEFKGVQSFTYFPYATLFASENQLPLSHDRMLGTNGLSSCRFYSSTKARTQTENFFND